MDTIQRSYNERCSKHSDIFEHLPALKKHASECESVAELGVRGVVSTWAFLQGLVENNKPSKHLYCVDIIDVPEIDSVIQTASTAGINMRFYKENSATVVLPRVDLLFIDTLHIYAHLKAELEHHHARTAKYIIMHDTEVDGVKGEAVRMGYDVNGLHREYGYPIEDITKGLQPAVMEFVNAHPEWKIHEHFKNCNGLTILKKSKFPSLKYGYS